MKLILTCAFDRNPAGNFVATNVFCGNVAEWLVQLAEGELLTGNKGVKSYTLPLDC